MFCVKGLLIEMREKFDDYYFSAGLKWTLVIGCIGSIYFSYETSFWWLALIVILMTIITFSMKYQLIVDMDSHQIVDSFLFLWVPISSEKISFATLDKITVAKERQRYSANTRSRERVVDFYEYIGALQYDTDKSIELKRSTSYQSFADDIKHIAERLNLQIERTF